MPKPVFLNIVTQCKGSVNDKDWRAFLHWGDSYNGMMYTIRGYGETPGQAADDAFQKFVEDPVGNITDRCEWK